MKKFEVSIEEYQSYHSNSCNPQIKFFSIEGSFNFDKFIGYNLQQLTALNDRLQLVQ